MRGALNIIPTRNYGKSSRTFSQIMQVLKNLPAGKRRILVYDIEGDYFKGQDGEMKKITTKKQLSDAIDDNNRYIFDGNDYSLKTQHE